MISFSISNSKDIKENFLINKIKIQIKNQVLFLCHKKFLQTHPNKYLKIE